MKQKSRVSLGPGAASLILIVVILSMSVLGILAMMNARSDSRLSKRSIEVVTAGYALNDISERTLASLDAVAARVGQTASSDEAYLTALKASLPSGMSLEERVVSWEETDGFRTLECAVEVAPLGAEPRLTWKSHRLTAVTEGTWN